MVFANLSIFSNLACLMKVLASYNEWHNWCYRFLRHKIAIHFWYYHLSMHVFLTTDNKDTMVKIISAEILTFFFNKCYSFCIYTIGIINFLGRQLFQPYWMYPSYQLHNWYYHFLRNELQYIFGIITKVALYFLTADKKFFHMSYIIGIIIFEA